MAAPPRAVKCVIGYRTPCIVRFAPLYRLYRRGRTVASVRYLVVDVQDNGGCAGYARTRTPGAVDASRTTRTTFVWERLMPAERIRIEHPVPALDAVRRRCAATPAENLSAIAILRELPHDTL